MNEFEQVARFLTLRPIEGVLAAVGGTRYSPFRASWSNTVSLLRRELEMHGARNPVLEVGFREQDLRLDGLPRATARLQQPGIALSFDAMKVPGRPHLRYEVVTFSDWQDNVRAVALALEALRAVDRYGVTRRGEQYAGWKQLVAGAGDSGDPSRGQALITKAGSVAAALKAAHPDHGGAPGDFRDVIAARDAAKAAA